MTTPIRCFEGNAQPHEPFWRWVDAADSQSGDPEMELYGYISEFSWWGDEVTPKKFKDQLYAKGEGGPVTVRMHSPGGDVIAASLMSTIIRDYPGHVTLQVDGLAASAATVVAIAADTVKMVETAYFMIHDPLAVFFLAMVNIDELEQITASLKAVKDGIVNAYETKTGLSRTRLSKLMSDETWMDARRAMDLGFVDEVIMPGGKATGGRGEEGKRGEGDGGKYQNVAFANALKNYRNVPGELVEQLQTMAGFASPERILPVDQVVSLPEPDGLGNGESVAAEVIRKLRAEVKLLKKEN